MISFFYIYFLPFVFNYKMPFIPKPFILYCQSGKSMGENEISKKIDKNVTNADIMKFIENIKKVNTASEVDIDIDVWDDGEVEW